MPANNLLLLEVVLDTVKALVSHQEDASLVSSPLIDRRHHVALHQLFGRTLGGGRHHAAVSVRFPHEMMIMLMMMMMRWGGQTRPVLLLHVDEHCICARCFSAREQQVEEQQLLGGVVPSPTQGQKVSQCLAPRLAPSVKRLLHASSEGACTHRVVLAGLEGRDGGMHEGNDKRPGWSRGSQQAREGITTGPAGRRRVWATEGQSHR